MASWQLWDSPDGSDHDVDPSEWEEGIAIDTEDDELMEQPDDLTPTSPYPREPEQDIDVHNFDGPVKFKNGTEDLCRSCGTKLVRPKHEDWKPFYILPTGQVVREQPACPPYSPLKVH